MSQAIAAFSPNWWCCTVVWITASVWQNCTGKIHHLCYRLMPCDIHNDCTFLFNFVMIFHTGVELIFFSISVSRVHSSPLCERGSAGSHKCRKSKLHNPQLDWAAAATVQHKDSSDLMPVIIFSKFPFYFHWRSDLNWYNLLETSAVCLETGSANLWFAMAPITEMDL